MSTQWPRNCPSQLYGYVRRQRGVASASYIPPEYLYALVHRPTAEASQPGRKLQGWVAVYLRPRNEACHLEERPERQTSACTYSLLLYRDFSVENRQEALGFCPRYGQVAVIKWLRKHASPQLEHNSTARTRGRRSERIGCIDVDGFVIARDSRSTSELMNDFGDLSVATLLRCHYGLNSPRLRLQDWVIQVYARRPAEMTHQIEIPSRFNQVTCDCNRRTPPYSLAHCAVREDVRCVNHCMTSPSSAVRARIDLPKNSKNHLDKGARKLALDKGGMKESSRLQAKAQAEMTRANDVGDLSVAGYFQPSRTFLAVQELTEALR